MKVASLYSKETKAMWISVKEKVGQRCIVGEDGQKIYDLICDPLKDGESVTLDFRGVSQFASPFFNYAIGQLLKDIRVEDFRRLLLIEYLNETGTLVLERVIENASIYHSDKDYSIAIDDILAQRAVESD